MGAPRARPNRYGACAKGGGIGKDGLLRGKRAWRNIARGRHGLDLERLGRMDTIWMMGAWVCDVFIWPFTMIVVVNVYFALPRCRSHTNNIIPSH